MEFSKSRTLKSSTGAENNKVIGREKKSHSAQPIYMETDSYRGGRAEGNVNKGNFNIRSHEKKRRTHLVRRGDSRGGSRDFEKRTSR